MQDLKATSENKQIKIVLDKLLDISKIKDASTDFKQISSKEHKSEDAVFRNQEIGIVKNDDSNKPVFSQQPVLSSSTSEKDNDEKLLDIENCEFIIDGYNSTELLNNNVEKRNDNAVNCAKFSEFSLSSSTVDENMNKTYTLVPVDLIKPQSCKPVITDIIILKPGNKVCVHQSLEESLLTDVEDKICEFQNTEEFKLTDDNIEEFEFPDDRQISTTNQFHPEEKICDLQNIKEFELSDDRQISATDQVHLEDNDFELHNIRKEFLIIDDPKFPENNDNNTKNEVKNYNLPHGENCSENDNETEDQENVILLPQQDEDDDICDKDYLPDDEEQSSDEEEQTSDDDEGYSDEEVENDENPLNLSKKTADQNSTINNSSFSSSFAMPGKSSLPPTGLKVQTSLGKSGKFKSHFCFYCKTMQLSIARHLERKHSDEKLVKKFVSLKRKSEERRKAIDLIRKKGDFLHNTDPMYNQGYLITVRRNQKGKEKQPEEMINCPKCAGFYTQNNIRHHYSDCNDSNLGNTRTLLQKACRKIGRVHPDATYKMRHDIIPVLRKNCEVTDIIRYDRLIILFGNMISMRFKLAHQDVMIRSQLRLLGRVVLELRKIDHRIEDLAAVFHPSFFNDLLQAVNVVANFNEKTQKYGSPSTAFAIGTALRKCSAILRCEYVVMMDKVKRELVEEFMIVFDTKFGTYINRNVAETQIDMRRNKQVVLPNTQDISTLSSYLVKERDSAYESLKTEFSINAWKHLNEVLLIHLMVFNRRRRGEIQLLSLEDYEKRQRIDEQDDMYKDLPTNGKKCAKEYNRIVLRGKKARAVAVLVCQQTLQCMALLKEFREIAGVHKKNSYFFAVPSADGERCKSLEACELLRKYSMLCGAEKPETLRGTGLRKHLATTCATKCSETQISQVANFMGHDLKIHKEYYQQPTVAVDIVGISDVLKSAQTPKAGVYFLGYIHLSFFQFNIVNFSIETVELLN